MICGVGKTIPGNQGVWKSAPGAGWTDSISYNRERTTTFDVTKAADALVHDGFAQPWVNGEVTVACTAGRHNASGDASSQ
ncbi:MAG: hypothetical protein H0X43_02240 [Nitrosospira sp.]|nr:hypothetical protein [Nitrosospira sp.]